MSLRAIPGDAAGADLWAAAGCLENWCATQVPRTLILRRVPASDRRWAYRESCQLSQRSRERKDCGTAGFAPSVQRRCVGPTRHAN